MVVHVDLRYSHSFSSFALRGKRYASDDMLLLLDWDDTMFPTTYLESRGINDPSEASHRLCGVIARLERRLIRLVNCRTVSNVAIVTIASEAWVRDCLVRWMPNLRSALNHSDVEILSATDRYSSGDGYDRKYRAFRHFYEEEDEVVVVGDGAYEKWASKAMANLAPNVSFIEFVDNPTPEQLVEQIDFAHSCLRPLASRYEAADFQLAFSAESDSDSDSDSD